MKKQNDKVVRFSFNQYQQQLYDEFYADLLKHIRMAKSQQTLLVDDFNRALRYYLNNGIALPEALERISPQHLGGFYSHPALNWYPLDNAAIIYPGFILFLFTFLRW